MYPWDENVVCYVEYIMIKSDVYYARDWLKQCVQHARYIKTVCVTREIIKYNVCYTHDQITDQNMYYL